MTTSIRRAFPVDADALAELGATTFIETFGHLYTSEDLQAFLDESHTEAAYAKVLTDGSPYALWLAERDGRAIGYAQAGPCGLPHADVRAEDGEIKRLYLRGDAQNCGAGRILMDAMLAWLLRDGPRTLWLSVYSENYGAQRFYARYGFEFAGEYAFIVGAQRDREFIYRRPAQA
ncbi:GNAT family N-acetyltransferase [Thermomonas sp.]|uniref:GNAT family N-acetyltransferase n=1 Tax=Thermomonas sp. TaxID=1971895 RepID=UPI002601AED0|nr:GNAT family N-acetyltransferase [Thermomonas sp.]MCO5055298.1 GNAT family N-acetyltransferase [Thermomonas sp.]